MLQFRNAVGCKSQESGKEMPGSGETNFELILCHHQRVRHIVCCKGRMWKIHPAARKTV